MDDKQVRQLLNDSKTVSIQIVKIFKEHNTGKLASAIAMLTILGFLKETEPRTYEAAVLLDECLEASRHSKAGNKTLSQEEQTRIATLMDETLASILEKHKNKTGDKD